VENWFLHGFVWFALGLVVWKNGFYMVLCGLDLVSWCGKWFLHGFVWLALGLVVWKNGFYMVVMEEVEVAVAAVAAAEVETGAEGCVLVCPCQLLHVRQKCPSTTEPETEDPLAHLISCERK
jgi:hypothetical protein